MLLQQEFANGEGRRTVHQINTADMPIGRQLKLERTIAGVSLTLVARAVGVSIGQLSRIESGHRTATPELIERIRVAVRAAGENAA